ncbi:MAG TPA: hypothetical protein VFM51_04245 [Solirubrobacterales bacterium]|nr:hypothetical protein [Solirubrobacterales bacterium]
MRNSKLWVMALCTVAVAALVAPAGAAAAIKVKSTVTITTGEGAKFTGKVSSAKKKCRAARTVKLFRKEDDGSGDELVRTAKTNKSGQWTMNGSFFAGEYYARVIAILVHINGMAYRCMGDFSLRQRY